MNTFEIALRSGTLPDRIEDLVPMMFAGQAAVKFMNAKLKLVTELSTQDPLGLLEEQRKKTVEDGQNVGEMLIKIMGRIGELAEKIPQKDARKYSNTSEGKIAKSKGGFGHNAKHGMLGLKDHNQLKAAQLIHRESKKPGGGIVGDMIKEAKSHDDIPNVTMIIQKHRHNLAEERRKKEASKRPENVAAQYLDAQKYLLKLMDLAMRLPKEPPKHWNNEQMKQARNHVAVILRKLAPFIDNKKRLAQ